MKKLSLMILAGFVAFSCAKDPLTPDNGQTKGGISIKFSSGEFDQVATRATAESALKDVTVLQYVDGKLKAQINLEDRLFSEAQVLDGLVSMPAATMKEVSDGRGGVKLVLNENGQENMLVFLANYKAASGAVPTLALESTYAALQAHTIQLANAAALSAMEYTPMTGYYLDGITEGVTNQINASLSRSLAKINFTLNTDNFKVNGKTPAVVVNKIELCDVPTQITLFNANRPALPVDGANGVTPEGFASYPAVANFGTLDMTMNQSTGNKSLNFVGYMPENARGSFSAITSNMDKKPSKLPVENQAGLTYILVDLTFTTSEGVISNAIYKIYLGGNDKGDMNILGNAQYNVTTYLYGANAVADTRITVTESFNPTIVTGFPVPAQKNANSYIINGDVANNTFFLPLTQARIGWNYISSSLADVTKSAAFDALIAGSDWEIVTLWRTWGAGDAVSNVTGVKTSGLTGANGAENYFATLTFPAGIAAGNNAVVALKQISTGKIFWSWHLWFTDYNPNTVVSGTGTPKVVTTAGEIHQYFGQSFTSAGYNNGKYIMDRNFGATHTGGTINSQPQTTAEAVKTYGMMYQWGRKDPFTASANGTSTTVNTFITSAQAVPVYNASGTQIMGADNDIDGFPKVAWLGTNVLAEATQSPMSFYTSSSDWTLRDDALWLRSSKTVFDPCPAGWRIPSGGSNASYNPWAGFSSNIAGSTIQGDIPGKDVFTLAGTVSGNSGTGGRLYDRGAQDASGVKAWYPATGGRNIETGIFYSVGSNCYNWASESTSTGTSYFMYATNANSVLPANSTNRASSYPVRCIQE